MTKTLVKFVLSFQNFGKKIACAVRHNRIQPLLQYGYVALRMRFFSQNFGTIKRILPGSSSPSHREGPGTEVAITVQNSKITLDRPQCIAICSKFKMVSLLLKTYHLVLNILKIRIFKTKYLYCLVLNILKIRSMQKFEKGLVCALSRLNCFQVG